MKKLIKMFQCLTLLIAGLLIVLLLIPFLLKQKSYVVLSGSMEPIIKTGSIVYINTKVKPNDIKTNDIIGFKIAKGYATHRVTKVNKNNTFTTKGDANKEEDITPVSYNNYIGKVIFHIPYLGFLLSFMKSKPGIIVLSIIIVLNIVIIILEKEKLDEKEN